VIWCDSDSSHMAGRVQLAKKEILSLPISQSAIAKQHLERTLIV
jgi:hypothetical protein